MRRVVLACCGGRIRALIDAYIEGLPNDVDNQSRRAAVDRLFSERNVDQILKVIEANPPYGEPKAIFVSSLTNDGGDRLSPWRGYSNGCQGFSLRFDKLAL